MTSIYRLGLFMICVIVTYIGNDGDDDEVSRQVNALEILNVLLEKGSMLFYISMKNTL